MATFRTSQCQDGDEVLKCREWRCQGTKRRFRKPEHTKEHIKKDSNRYFVEKFWTQAKFKLWTFERGKFLIYAIQDKGRTIRKLMGGGTGEVQKKDSRKGKFNFKKFLHAINPKKYSCKGLKKNHTRNLIKKKNSCGSKIPLPPLPFSNGPSLNMSKIRDC